MRSAVPAALRSLAAGCTAAFVLLTATACAATAPPAAADAAQPAGATTTTPKTAAPAATTATTSPRFEIESADGRVVRIVLHPAAGSERYVFDGFVDDAAAVRDEAARIAARPAKPAFCAAFADAAACRQSCGWAEAARPFTRVTRYAADGAAHRLSGSDAVPLRLNAGAGSHSNLHGDCLSPDGRYLSVFVAAGAGAQAALPSVVELTDGLPDVRFAGRRSAKVYGEDRYFDFAGWLPAAEHTLRFSYGGGDEPLDDEAVPAR
jgi:hypothetical protein